MTISKDKIYELLIATVIVAIIGAMVIFPHYSIFNKVNAATFDRLMAQENIQFAVQTSISPFTNYSNGVTCYIGFQGVQNGVGVNGLVCKENSKYTIVYFNKTN